MGIKIEDGKFYRTRNGLKVFVAACAENPFVVEDRRPFVGYFESGTHAWWGADGNCSLCSRHDIVEEWKELKRIKGWVNITIDNNGDTRVSDLYETRERADNGFLVISECRTRIACIQIDCLEGEGLGGEQ